MTLDTHESSGNVIQDLGITPEVSEKLRIKAKLLAAIEAFIEAKGLTQAQTAELMGVSRPRISDAVRGKIDKFTIDALVDMLARIGVQVDVTTTPA